MKASKFTDAQKAFIIRQGDEGTSVAEICRKVGISQATYFNWKKKYTGMMPSEMKRLRELEDENGRLKRIVADLWLDQEMLQDIVRVSWWMRCAPRERYRLRSSDSNARRRLVLGLTLRSFNLWSVRTTIS